MIRTVEQKNCFADHLFKIEKQIEKVDFNLMLSTKSFFYRGEGRRERDQINMITNDKDNHNSARNSDQGSDH